MKNIAPATRFLIALALLAPALAAATALGDEAHGTVVGLRDTVRAEIDSADDADTFVLEAVAGTKLDLALSPNKGEGLSPRALLVDPGGRLVSTSDAAKWKRGALRWKGVELRETGRYSVIVRSQGLSTGGYRLKLRGKPPAKRRTKALAVAPGQSVRITYGAFAESVSKIRVQARSGSFDLGTIECPADEVQQHAFSASRGGDRRTARVRHGDAFGVRAFTLTAGEEGVVLDVAFTFSHPRVKARRVELGAEPTVYGVTPPTARAGDRVTVEGADFAVGPDGTIRVLFGGVLATHAVLLDSGRVEVTVPEGAALVDVLLLNADGQEATVADAFRYASDDVGDTVDDSLAAYWRFDRTTGITVPDLSEGASTGSVSGGALWSGDALTFDGIDDRVTYTDIYGDTPSHIGDIRYGTISAWVRYDDVTNNHDQVADSLPLLYYGISYDDYIGGLGTDALCVYIGHTGMEDSDKRQIYLTVIADDEIKLCIDSNAISLEPGRWYHYAITIGPDGHHGYLDGVEFEKRYNAGTGPSSHGFFSSVEDEATLMSGHGWLGITGNWWHHNGRLTDTRIYDRVLSAAEIAELASSR